MRLGFRTLEWRDDALVLLDQTRLPEEEVDLACRTKEEVWQAIRRLAVRGAPAIGVAAAYGVVLGVRGEPTATRDAALVEKVCDYLATSRPTAVNLFWALDRMRAVKAKNGEALDAALLGEAQRIETEDAAVCKRIGEHGAALLSPGDTVLTHCNAGALATAGMGTALAVVYRAVAAGKRVAVYADETRPLLQGSRLTAWELSRAGIPVTLICDNMAATVLRQKKISVVITGADRIAANGDSANKIGTYGLAILAREHGVPFYIAAPISTLDLSLASGEAIPIEERAAEEICNGMGKRTAPEGVAVYNPAFDVTPARYIAGIITEAGVARPPYERSLAELVGG